MMRPSTNGSGCLLVLLALLPHGLGCKTTISYDQVEVVGLQKCGGGVYRNPIMVQVVRGDDVAQYTLTSDRNATVAFRKDKKTQTRVRVGLCGNKLVSPEGRVQPSYKCRKPAKWYYDQAFTYDPKSPQKLAVPQPSGGQECVRAGKD